MIQRQVLFLTLPLINKFFWWMVPWTTSRLKGQNILGVWNIDIKQINISNERCLSGTLFDVAMFTYTILRHYLHNRDLVVLEALDFLNHHLHNLKVYETGSSLSHFLWILIAR